jgi:hypothetical protein
MAREAAGKTEDGPARATKAATASKPKAAVNAQREDNEVDSRARRVFDRIAKAVETRGDSELAEILREDAEIMAQGLVSLTKSIKFLRTPLLILLNLVEPVLAFGRIGRLLYNRLAERQERRAMERQEQQQGLEVVQ